MKRRIYWSSEIAGAHILILPYDSPCRRLHGHNWKIEIEIESQGLVNGMIVDYNVLSKIVKRLDHKLIVPSFIVVKKIDKWLYIDVNEKHLEVPENEVVQIPYDNVTVECMAEYIAMQLVGEISKSEWKNAIIGKVVVRVWEDSRSYAEVELNNNR